MKKLEQNIIGEPFAFIVVTKHAGFFNVTVEVSETVNKKVPVKITSESDPIRYENKVAKEIVKKNIVLQSVPCVTDFLGNKITENIQYTTNIVAFKDLVNAKCEGAEVYFLCLGGE
jgi:hypothetical protein